ncbi:hypothetical protein [Thermus oshimai]|uniref:hypothetical protein n=1 Tax=Thermus oshimai TaxID=56957 RepID=UPI0003663059|nr:hypothetical protein [Thermus oshimai]
MRTTVDLPDPLYRRLKVQAAKEGKTLRALLIRYLEEGLARSRSTSPKCLPQIPEAGRRIPPLSHADLWALLEDHGPS